jgi:hypothetical protein
VTTRTWLELGRTSNVPTVWSNVLCGAVLASGTVRPLRLLVLVVAGSALYIGGMFLNDAFDAAFDARMRPERPIPSGRATRRAVFAAGFSLLAVAIVLLASAAALGITELSAGATLAGVLTIATIVAYDRWHKGFAWSPVLMGACRAGLYGIAALASAPVVPARVVWAAAALLLYVVGLTHIARFETASTLGRVWPSLFVLTPLVLVVTQLSPLVAVVALAQLAWTLRALALALRGGPGRIPRAVVSLIAGIALVDAGFLAAVTTHGAAMAVGAFLLTLVGQRRIRGT